MKLLTNIQSTFNPKHIYGNAGDEVLLVAEKGVVLIVEHVKTKERFPVLKINVGNESAPIRKEAQPFIQSKPFVKTQKKYKPNLSSQKNLFA